MRRFPLKLAIILCFLIVGFQSLYSQTARVKLTLTFKFNKEHVDLWDSVFIHGKDTSCRLACPLFGNKLSLLLKPGNYSVTLHSKSMKEVKKSVVLNKDVNLPFAVENYYKSYKDTASISRLMKPGDTSYIIYTSGMRWAPEEDYFMVVRDEDKFNVITKNQLNQWISIQVFDYEIGEFIALGKYKPVKKGEAIESLGVYYWTLGNIVLKRPCGTCLYGFLYRKRLVRQR
jgi:hypothetical protein